jgi:hypothetical protein
MEERKNGFYDTILGATGVKAHELVIDGGKTDAQLFEELSIAFEGYPYNVVLLGGLRINEINEIDAFERVIDRCKEKPSRVPVLSMSVPMSIMILLTAGSNLAFLSSTFFSSSSSPRPACNSLCYYWKVTRSTRG